jgi:hypothetical protein
VSVFPAHARERRQAATDQLESYVLEAWATGPDGAYKVSVRVDGEPNPTEVADMTRMAVGGYRYCYGAWSTGSGHRVAPA